MQNGHTGRKTLTSAFVKGGWDGNLLCLRKNVIGSKPLDKYTGNLKYIRITVFFEKKGCILKMHPFFCADNI